MSWDVEGCRGLRIVVQSRPASVSRCASCFCRKARRCCGYSGTTALAHARARLPKRLAPGAHLRRRVEDVRVAELGRRVEVAKDRREDRIDQAEARAGEEGAVTERALRRARTWRSAPAASARTPRHRAWSRSPTGRRGSRSRTPSSRDARRAASGSSGCRRGPGWVSSRYSQITLLSNRTALAAVGPRHAQQRHLAERRDRHEPVGLAARGRSRRVRRARPSRAARSRRAGRRGTAGG